MPIKYDINDFYIGQLFLSEPKFGNCEEIELKDDSYVDYKRDKLYQAYLTLFYKTNSKFLNLCDGNFYTADDINYCRNFVKLKSLLPSYDYERPSEISLYEAKNIFDYLFKTKQTFFQGEIKVPLSQFYVGDVNIYGSTTLQNVSISTANLTSQLLLLRKGGYEIGHYTKVQLPDKKYNFKIYKTLLLKQGNGMYSLHNNQLYNKGNFERFFSSQSYEQNFYERILMLDDSNEQVTIDQALEQFKESYYLKHKSLM